MNERLKDKRNHREHETCRFHPQGSSRSPCPCKMEVIAMSYQDDHSWSVINDDLSLIENVGFS